MPIFLMSLLVVNTQPWGEVVRVATGEGAEIELPENPFTPLPLELPPGSYRVEVSRPDLDEVETCEVVVESETRVDCDLQLAVVETSELFKQTGWWQ